MSEEWMEDYPQLADRDWIAAAVRSGLRAKDMAEKLKCPYETVVEALRYHSAERKIIPDILFNNHK